MNENQIRTFEYIKTVYLEFMNTTSLVFKNNSYVFSKIGELKN